MKKLSSEKKKLFSNTLMLINALALVLFAAFAWFSLSQTTQGDGVKLDAASDSNATATIFHRIKNTDGTLKEEVQVDEIVIENFLPNQSEEYRILISNPTESTKTVKLVFSNINDAFICENPAITPNILLTRVIKIMSLSTDFTICTLNESIVSGMNNTMFELYGSDDTKKRDITVAHSIEAPPNGSGSIYLTFNLDSAANNSYQTMGIAVESVEIISGNG